MTNTLYSYSNVHLTEEDALAHLEEVIRTKGSRPGKKWDVLSWNPDDCENEDGIVSFFFAKLTKDQLSPFAAVVQKSYDTDEERVQAYLPELKRLGNVALIGCSVDDFNHLFETDEMFVGEFTNMIGALMQSGKVDLKKGLRK